MTGKQKKTLIRIIVALVLFGIIFATEKITAGKGMTLPWYIIFPLYLIPYITAGYDVLIKCFRNIINGKLLDESFLMTVATFGAFALSLYTKESEYAEAVFVMVFYQVGELFQSIAVGKSRKSISSLMNIRPDTAVVERNGEETEVFPEEVEQDEIIVVRPGEKIALDGIIVSGETDTDTAALTGESLPVPKKEGDAVLSGSVNLTGAIKIRTTKAYEDSTVAKILELIENSSFNKAKTELMLTKFARIYTPAVVGLAVLLALAGSLISGEPAVWISRALVFLVVSCPCAIVISVPMAYFGGIGGASSKGILIKGSNYLEALASADTFVFDKTGTLTSGKFSVKEIQAANGFSEKELLCLAASAEMYSLHPIGLSVLAAAGENAEKPETTENISGMGVKAKTSAGTVLAGNGALMEKNGIEYDSSDVTGTVIFVAVNGVYAGRIIIDDTVKEGVAEALSSLYKSGAGKTVMLTGDNGQKAKAVGSALGIDEIHFSLLPADKVDKMNEMCENKQDKKTIAYVGDGINDAPVLARSDVGIAMGGIGSDAAIEAADIVIMDDNLKKLPLAVKIARQTRLIVKQNIVFALAVKVGVLVLSAFGFANMWVGVLADVGVAILCILNSMRTLKQKD